VKDELGTCSTHGKKIGAYKGLVGKSEGKILFERNRIIIGNNIKIYLK
jgi:hypothetical protein